MEFLEEILNIDITSNSSLDSYDLDDTDEDNDFFMPVWRRILWTVLFGLIAVVGTFGNLIVIWIVLAHKIMRTVTNIFIVNLAAADAMVAMLNVTFSSYSMIYTNWPFGTVYCKISEFVAGMNIAVSVLTLSAISIDRYITIINPFQLKMGKRKTLLIIGAIWITSFVISLPNWIFVTTTDVEFEEGDERTICHTDWPESYLGKFQEHAYSVLFMGVTYIFPLACMSFTYYRVGEKLWMSTSIGESTQNQIDNIQAKRKVVKMMIVVVVMFAVCWFPYHLIHVVMTMTDRAWPMYTREIFLACFWMAMSNSMYNPIIYCWMNKKFRTGFKKSIRWCPCVNYTPGKILEDSDSSIRTGTSQTPCLD